MADYDSSQPIYSRDASKPVAVSATTAANAVTNPIFVKVSDGTNTMPTGDVVGRHIFVRQTDGTNTMPTMDANIRAGFIKVTDGAGELTIHGDATALGTPKGIFTMLSDGVNAQLPIGDTAGRPYVRVTNDSTNFMPTMHANTAAAFIKITDGTDELDIVADGAAHGTAKGLFAMLSDGTNAQYPVGDSSGRQYIRVTNDGTNFMPTGHAVGSAIYQYITDGVETAAVSTGNNLHVNLAEQSIGSIAISKNNTANSETNPLFVKTVDTQVSGTEVLHYDTTVNVAGSGAYDDHVYGVAAGKTFLLKKVQAAASGAMKVVVLYQTQSAGVWGTENILATGFTSMAAPTFVYEFANPVEITDPAGTDEARVIVRRYNREAVAMDVYSTVEGNTTS